MPKSATIATTFPRGGCFPGLRVAMEDVVPVRESRVTLATSTVSRTALLDG
jgi:hypothetical protein